MARDACRSAGLICAALAASWVCGCSGSPEQHPAEEITATHIVSRMYTLRREEKIVARARSDEYKRYEAKNPWFDLVAEKCFATVTHDSPEKIHKVLIHSPNQSYVPEEKYWLIGYVCLKDRMWYYLYRDRTREVLLGPYFYDRPPTPAVDPK